MHPVISYEGREVRVTPDTARDLVERGLATLVSGELPEPGPKAEAQAAAPAGDDADKPDAKPATTANAKPAGKPRGRRAKK